MIYLVPLNRLMILTDFLSVYKITNVIKLIIKNLNNAKGEKICYP